MLERFAKVIKFILLRFLYGIFLEYNDFGLSRVFDFIPVLMPRTFLQHVNRSACMVDHSGSKGPARVETLSAMVGKERPLV